jgi:predicted heme/steroid binding protein
VSAVSDRWRLGMVILGIILIGGFLLFGCLGEEGSGGSSGGSGGSGGDIYEVGEGAGEGGLHPGESPYETGREIPMSEVVLHNSLGDCWIVIGGKVYDVDAYITVHPGGNGIVDYCGEDATSAFESKPGSGEAHSDYARGVLGEHYVGELE